MSLQDVLCLESLNCSAQGLDGISVKVRLNTAGLQQGAEHQLDGEEEEQEKWHLCVIIY